MVMGDGSLTGNLMAMQQEAQEQWCSKVYCDPKRVAPDIQAAIDKHDGLLRRHRKEHLLHPLDGAALEVTLKKWSRSKAGGTDGWEAALFKDIPLVLLDRLAEFYGLVELGAPWPRALVEGLMALVPKKTTAGGALEQRPITLTNLGYRLWSGTRCRESSSWLRAWAHPRSGGGPGRGPELVWGPIALRAEAAKSTGDPLGGISADLWKYYDLISPEIALGFLESLGLSSRVALPLKAFYRDLFRFMSLNGVTAPGFRSSQAVLQGCAWSNPLAFAIAFAWASRVEEAAAVWAYFYADDWYLVCDRYSLGQRRTPSSRAGAQERQEQTPPCPPAPQRHANGCKPGKSFRERSGSTSRTRRGQPSTRGTGRHRRTPVAQGPGGLD
jgi:hypothetical protein